MRIRVFLRPQGRFPALPLLNHFSSSVRSVIAALLFVCAAASAHAVVVRGTVTDRLGAAVRGAHVNLIQNGKAVTSAVSGSDGSFELTSASTGRFVVTGIGRGFGLAVSEEFYSGKLSVITEDIILKPASVNDEVTVVASGYPTPEAQLSTVVDVIHAEDLTTRVGIVDSLRMMPGVNAVQTGQVGAQTSLYVRGGQTVGNKVLIDGVEAGDVGGLFDFGTVATTGIESIAVARTPDSVIFGSDATSSVLAFEAPRGVTARPVLNYSGDAGDFGSYRNEITVGGTRSKLDYYGGFSRFDTSNALPLDRYHDATSVANLGYALGSTQVRFTLRNSVSATGVPNAHDFYGISDDSKQADQDLYAGATVDNRTAADWHNLVRYGISRKREQFSQWLDTGLPGNVFGSPVNLGAPVTIRGANGYSASGQAVLSFVGPTGLQFTQANNRDALQYQTDYRINAHTVVFGYFEYQRERGFAYDPFFSPKQDVFRTNYAYGLQVQGDAWNRLFYSLGGGLQKNQLFGLKGEPRLGLAYYVVRPGGGFRGTKLRFNFSKAVQEADISTQLESLQTVLLANGEGSVVTALNIQPVKSQDLRSYEGGVDQNLFGQKLLFKGSFFHNEFGKQKEFVGAAELGNAPFNLPAGAVTALNNSTGGAYINTLAYRAMGFEAALEWRPISNLFVRGGYTYLDTVTQHSFSSSVLSPVFFQNNPKIPIGAGSSLIGARAFRRPPHTGFVSVEYIEKKWTDGLQIAMVSRSDDSTVLSFSDASGGNSLLLPNRNLDYGYVKVDVNEAYQVTPRVGVFLQVDNLLNNQHIGPIGYPGMPLSYRAGVKVRIGGN